MADIMALNNLQNNIGLKFAHKLTSQHLNYRNSIGNESEIGGTIIEQWCGRRNRISTKEW